MLRDILVEICTSVAILALVVLTSYAAKMFHIKCEQWQSKTDSESLRALIEKVDYIVQTCVEATNQTIVDDLKKKGALTDEEKRRAFNKTFESVQNMLTDEDKQRIADNFGDISTYVTNSVENYIKTSKIENIDIPI